MYKRTVYKFCLLALFRSQMKVSMPMPLSPSLPAYREELLNFIEENYVTEETVTTAVLSTTTTISSTTTTMSTTTTTYASLDLIEEQGNRDFECRHVFLIQITIFVQMEWIILRYQRIWATSNAVFITC